MFRSRVKLEIGERDRGAVLALLRGIVHPTRANPGCIDSCLCGSVEPGSHICFSTLWRERKQMDQFVRSSDFRHVLAAMELADAPPEVAFEEVGDSQGLNYVETLLRAGDRSG